MQREENVLPNPRTLPLIPIKAPSPPLDPPEVKEVLKGFSVLPQKESHSSLFREEEKNQYKSRKSGDETNVIIVCGKVV